MVAIFVVEGHGALVGVEDFPLVKLRLSLAFGLFQKRLRKSFRQGASRHCNAENIVTLDRGVLRVKNVCAQAGRELVDVLEGV